MEYMNGLASLITEYYDVLLVALYLLGVGARTIWPYYLSKREGGGPWDWNYVIGQWIGAIIGLFGVLAAKDFVSGLGAAGLFGSFVLGYGAASAGRDVQKPIDSARGK